MITPGMLWQSNNLLDEDPEEAIRLACVYYEEKYGAYPNLVYLNKNVFVDDSPIVDGDTISVGQHNVVVSSHQYVIPRHIWVGFSSKHKDI